MKTLVTLIILLVGVSAFAYNTNDPALVIRNSDITQARIGIQPDCSHCEMLKVHQKQNNLTKDYQYQQTIGADGADVPADGTEER